MIRSLERLHNENNRWITPPRALAPDSRKGSVVRVSLKKTRNDGMGFLLKAKTLALIAMSGGLVSKNRSIQ